MGSGEGGAQSDTTAMVVKPRHAFGRRVTLANTGQGNDGIPRASARCHGLVHDDVAIGSGNSAAGIT